MEYDKCVVDRFRLLNKRGLTNKQISKILGVPYQTLIDWQHRLGLPKNFLVFNCCVCGKEFKSIHPKSKRCVDCRKVQRQEFLEIRNLRFVFWETLRKSPFYAVKLFNEMLWCEGDSFVLKMLGKDIIDEVIRLKKILERIDCINLVVH